MNSTPAGPLGAQSPRVRHRPPTAFDFADGDEAVALASGYALTADQWQRDVTLAWLARRRDGRLAAGRCGLAVPRQNGKNGVLEIVELHKMVAQGRKILHTAHEVKTARKAFVRLRSFFENERQWPEMAALVAEGGIRSTNGQEAILLRNGGSIEFVARSRGSGRGFTVDDLVCDEAQELTDEQLEALKPTISAAPSGDPQTIYTGTPPPPGSPGTVFARVRAEGVAGKDRRLCWDEWSIPDDADIEQARHDQAAAAATNPALGTRLLASTVEDERGDMSAEGYARERLGKWDRLAAGVVIAPSQWSDCLDVSSSIQGEPVFVLDVSPMSSWACIVAAGLTADGRTHVEITSDGTTLDYRPGVEWVVPHCRAIVERRPNFTLWVVAGSAAEALIPELLEAGVTVETLSKPDNASACVRFVSRVASRGVAHIGQRELTAAVAAGAKRTADEGLWTWGRIKSSADVAPLVAATAGVWLAQEADYDVMDSIG